MTEVVTVKPHLERCFVDHRVVFWHDLEGQYTSDLDSLDLLGVTTIRVANDEYAIKHRLLHDQPEDKFLVYRSGLDMLAASQEGGDPPKQTVSVKAISVTGVTGVLETEEDVDKYLAALRNALVQTLNDGKRISL